MISKAMIILPDFPTIAKDMSEFLSPDEGNSNEVVVKKGKIISSLYGVVDFIMAYDKSSESMLAYSKHEKIWKVVGGSGNCEKLEPAIENLIW